MARIRKTGVDIQKLIERSEAARGTLAQARVELRHRFDFASRMKETLTSAPAKLIGGTVVAGYLLKKILYKKTRRSDSGKALRISHLKKERGVLLGVLAALTALAKPAAKMYATKLLKDYFKKRFESGSGRHPVQGSIPRY